MRRLLASIFILGALLALPSAAAGSLDGLPVVGAVTHGATVGEGSSNVTRPQLPAGTPRTALPKAVGMLVETLLSDPESCTRGEGGSCAAVVGL